MGMLTSLFKHGFSTPAAGGEKTISSEYAQLNAQLHASRPDYGTSGQQWAAVVTHLVAEVGAISVLDYGCGKQTLAKALPELKITGSILQTSWWWGRNRELYLKSILQTT